MLHQQFYVMGARGWQPLGFREMASVVDDVHTLKSAEKFCLAMIADRTAPAPEVYGDEIPRAEIWIRELCRRTEFSRATVHRHLKTLEGQKLIHRDKQWDFDQAGRPRQKGSLVALNLPAIERGDFLNGEEPAGRAKSLKMRPTTNPFADSAGHGESLKMRPTGRESQNDGVRVSNTSVVSLNRETDNQSNEGKETFPPKSPSVFGEATAAPSLAANADGGEAALIENFGTAGIEEQKHGNEETSTKTAQESSADRELISKALPDSMRVLPADSIPGIAKMLRERIEAGWQEKQIRSVLESRSLPNEIQNLAGLVAYRLKEGVPTNDPPLATREGGSDEVHLMTSDGREVGHNEVDWGALAQAYHAAVEEGTCSSSTNRRTWVNEVGLEHFLV